MWDSNPRNNRKYHITNTKHIKSKKNYNCYQIYKPPNIIRIQVYNGSFQSLDLQRGDFQILDLQRNGFKNLDKRGSFPILDLTGACYHSSSSSCAGAAAHSSSSGALAAASAMKSGISILDFVSTSISFLACLPSRAGSKNLKFKSCNLKVKISKMYNLLQFAHFFAHFHLTTKFHAKYLDICRLLKSPRASHRFLSQKN